MTHLLGAVHISIDTPLGGAPCWVTWLLVALHFWWHGCWGRSKLGDIAETIVIIEFDSCNLYVEVIWDKFLFKWVPDFQRWVECYRSHRSVSGPLPAIIIPLLFLRPHDTFYNFSFQRPHDISFISHHYTSNTSPFHRPGDTCDTFSLSPWYLEHSIIPAPLSRSGHLQFPHNNRCLFT